MVKITRIKSQKNKNRVNIYLDGKFSFGLPAETLLKTGLTVGQELLEKEIENLFFENEFQRLLDKTLRLVSLRPRSEKEIIDYLDKNLPNHQSSASHLGRKLREKVLVKLKNQGLIDDDAFAVWWLEQRATFRPRGKFGLKAELLKKGIDRKIIDKVLSEVDEVSLAQKAADKKAKAYKKLPAQKFRQKMKGFLSRRGFSWEVIKDVLEGF